MIDKKELLKRIEDMKVYLNDYRLMTNRFVQENISEYRIKQYKKEQIDYNTNTYGDYSFDLYYYLDLRLFGDLQKYLESEESHE